MPRYAVCYTATSGYLFHTVFSAIQARARTDSSISVYVCFLGAEGGDERQKFDEICKRNGIEFVTAPLAAIGGLHPVYARLFLDELLPQDVEEILYLDGDTQIVSQIDALVFAEPPAGGALAVRDPMVFIREVNAGLGRKIDRWWDQSEIPSVSRKKYMNSGVLRIARSSLVMVRAEVLGRLGERLHTFHFPDQDALNIALGDRLQNISMQWNFPGFLLGTKLEELAPPRIIHFMSDPRPWNASLSPWGEAYYQPYCAFVRDNPEIERYWHRFTGRKKARYVLQQNYKYFAEGRSYQSENAISSVRRLEEECLKLI